MNELITQKWCFDLSRQEIAGLSRIGPRKLEISFSAPVTDAEFINTWLLLRKHFIPATARPEGWEPIDKSDPEAWEEA